MRFLALLAVLTVAAPAADAETPVRRHDHSRRDSDPMGWYVPDFAKLQTGGYSGLVTVGVGYSAFNDRWNFTLDYGFAPATVAGRNVHSVSTTWSYRPFDFRVGSVRFVPIYGGANLLFTAGNGYFLTVPERYRQYDKRYYPPTGVHWMAHLGTEIDFLPPENSFIERHGFYAELRTLDTYFVSYIENPKTVSFREVLASALGYRAAF